MSKSTQLDLTADMLGNRDTIRNNTSRGEEIVKIPLDKIIIRKGFNVREDYGDIESLSKSIKENGQQLPGRVDVLKDGTFVLTDGHRRFKAIKLLGKDYSFKAIVNDRKTTEEERLIQMFTTQDNKHLTPDEAATIIQRLLTFGKNQAEIARSIGKSPSYVSQLISFSREDKTVKDLVKSGQATVSTVLKTKKQIKNKADRTEKITSAASSNKKINVKDVTGKSERDQKIDLLTEVIAEAFEIKDILKLSQLIQKNY